MKIPIIIKERTKVGLIPAPAVCSNFKKSVPFHPKPESFAPFSKS